MTSAIQGIYKLNSEQISSTNKQVPAEIMCNNEIITALNAWIDAQDILIRNLKTEITDLSSKININPIIITEINENPKKH